jgi:small subunit ribosomal protein S1
VAAEYQDLYGEHAYDEQGNYIGPDYVGEEGAAAAEGEEGAAAAEAADAPEGSASEEAPVVAAAEEAPVASAPEAPADEVAGDEGEVSPA